MKYAFIKARQSEFNIDLMCHVLEVGRSSYYEWLRSRPSKRSLENQLLSDEIIKIFTKNKRRYGSRRIRKELQSAGFIISRRRVRKIMKRCKLQCKNKKAFRNTTDSNHNNAISPNLLNRDFSANKPDEKYVGDITYIQTNTGWLYLATVIDLYSRRIVGWSIQEHMKTSLVNDALLMAIWARKPKPGLLWHTDRGSQYASSSHRELLKTHGVVQSMSRKGNCWDNAVAESFFHTLKSELINGVNFKTKEEAKSAIFEYIEVYYNRKRLHSANDYCSPVNFENCI